MLKKILAASAVAAAASGMLLSGTGTAYAVDDIVTSGNGSILGGNQLVLDADIPINICGNAIAVIGVAGAQCNDSNAFVIDN